MTDDVKTVLFLCTGNSARSIMAEAIMRKEGGGRFAPFSAGSEPAGALNPLVKELLESLGHDLIPLRSKAWETLVVEEGLKPDIVITVCDDAKETCPVFPGEGLRVHWGFEDPASLQGSEAEKRARIAEIYGQIARRIELLVALPMESLNQLALKRQLQDIHDKQTDA